LGETKKKKTSTAASASQVNKDRTRKPKSKKRSKRRAEGSGRSHRPKRKNRRCYGKPGHRKPQGKKKEDWERRNARREDQTAGFRLKKGPNVKKACKIQTKKHIKKVAGASHERLRPTPIANAEKPEKIILRISLQGHKSRLKT